MALSVCNVNIINANVGSEPELKQIRDGLDLLSFSVAVNTERGNHKSTAWYRVSVWGKQAVTLAPMIHKGSLVHITGRLAPREYEAKDGTTRTSLDVTASDVLLPPRSSQPERQDDTDDVPF